MEAWFPMKRVGIISANSILLVRLQCVMTMALRSERGRIRWFKKTIKNRTISLEHAWIEGHKITHAVENWNRFINLNTRQWM